MELLVVVFISIVRVELYQLFVILVIVKLSALRLLPLLNVKVTSHCVLEVCKHRRLTLAVMATHWNPLPSVMSVGRFKITLSPE